MGMVMKGWLASCVKYVKFDWTNEEFKQQWWATSFAHVVNKHEG